MKYSKIDRNHQLAQAKRRLSDEFYTSYNTIHNELKHHVAFLEGKKIYCNCDDYTNSNFYIYLRTNFRKLKLKKLVATHYNEYVINIFDTTPYAYPVKAEYDGYNQVLSCLRGEGDFASEECLRLLDDSDIVITNPPFSRLKDFIPLMIKYDKKFMVLGHQNAIGYKHIFPHIKHNRVWLGKSIHSGDVEFEIPNDYENGSSSLRVDSAGRKYVSVTGIRWFTNIEYENRHADLELTCKFADREYPFYDYYNAINVDKTKEIPSDFYGVMGVPITFLDKYNPEQFRLLAITDSLEAQDTMHDKNAPHSRPTINGVEKYKRILIERIVHY